MRLGCGLVCWVVLFGLGWFGCGLNELISRKRDAISLECTVVAVVFYDIVRDIPIW